MGLAGANGAGKTTLFNIILGMIDYKNGQLRIGDCELKEIDIFELRKRITLISQSTYLFSGTVRENLLLGKPDADDELLRMVIEQVELEEWFTTLPDGFNSWVGEHGIRLSGGERRRLVIARSLLKNADIYLLDEPTQFLDPRTEERIIQLIQRVTEGKSVVWASHQLKDLESMDEIIVLSQGKISECGSYYDLIRKPGWFSNMTRIQNDFIREFSEEERNFST